MPRSKNLSVLVPGEVVEGERVNAFRVVDAPDGDYFLDFCWYSEDTESAVVVSRLLAGPGMVRAIASQLNTPKISDLSQLGVRFDDLRR